MTISKTQPAKPLPSFLTLKRKAEGLSTHAEGDVLGSPELKKQKVHGDAGEEVDDLESWADELEDFLLPESTEIDEESSLPIDPCQQAFLDEVNEMEAQERKANDKINSTDAPLDITEEFWRNPLVASFDESVFGSMFTDPIWLSWESYEYQITGTSDVEHEVMRLNNAAGTFGWDNTTAFTCESRKDQIDLTGIEKVYTSNLHDQQLMVDPPSSPQLWQTDSLRPWQYELHKNHEIIVID